VKLDQTQLSAISRATSAPFSIITGGAGTGKSTIIHEITNQLESRGEEVALAAFAGKAAARIREVAKHPASTIHRMLGYDGRNYTAPDLSHLSIIIDEASMIDAELLSRVTERRPRRLVLVGDQAQLPPVGRGQPFHDLIMYRPALVSNLTRCYRATEAVFQAASAIREGARPPMRATSEGEVWNMENTGNAKATQDWIIRHVKEGVFDFSGGQDVILVARNGESDADPCTVKGLNSAIVDAISPRDEKTKWRVGDRVINTKNLPDLDVWNGTTGTIHAIDIDGGIWVETDIPVIDKRRTEDERNPVYTSHVLFARYQRKHLQLAYALTVHKMQGSQARRVMFAAFNRDLHGLLDRSLLYTAVTRTKEACCVVGELSAVFTAVERVNHKRTIIQLLAEDQAA
jgi:exodeoxyribonuclease V alpha subunit